jgi:hypothetical protein
MRSRAEHPLERRLLRLGVAGEDGGYGAHDLSLSSLEGVARGMVQIVAKADAKDPEPCFA